MTCRIASVRWVWSPLWSLQVENGSRLAAQTVAGGMQLPDLQYLAPNIWRVAAG
ncbi:MAG TPA: hypothetical protein VHJ58_03630 [Vicinamibacterales bacterium]|nr:hypothetical protein [Vicinamibacterales bacterium]